LPLHSNLRPYVGSPSDFHRLAWHPNPHLPTYPYPTNSSPLITHPALLGPGSGVLNPDIKPSGTQDYGGHLLNPSVTLYAYPEKLLMISIDYIPIEKPERYFNVGRIFVTSWVEPRASVSTVPALSPSNGEIFAGPRYFVVVREGPGFAVCCSFESYPRGGLLAPAMALQHCALAFPTGNPPELSQAEKVVGLEEFPIRVENFSIKLGPIYLVNFGKPYTVEHGIKVATVGRIDRKFLGKLRAAFLGAMGGDVPSSEAGKNRPMNESAPKRYELLFPLELGSPGWQSKLLSDRGDGGSLPLSLPREISAEPPPLITHYNLPSDKLGGGYETVPPPLSIQVQGQGKLLHPPSDSPVHWGGDLTGGRHKAGSPKPSAPLPHTVGSPSDTKTITRIADTTTSGLIEGKARLGNGEKLIRPQTTIN
jgi:hypothetical protein